MADPPRRRALSQPATHVPTRDSSVVRDDLGFAHAQAALATTDFYQLLVDSVRDYAIFALDQAGYILNWNAGAQRCKGYTAEEIIAKHFSIFYLPEDVAKDKPAYELLVATAEGRFEEEGWRVRKDGSRFWANVVISVLRDQAGAVIGFAKVTRDLSVRDTGVGIPADKLTVIFEPFVQLGRSLTTSHEGTGLGLAISRDLARAMDGELTVDSAVGQGSTFTLVLPAA